MASPNTTLEKLAAIPSANQNRYVIFDLDNCLSDDRERMKLIDWDAPNPTLKYHAYHKQCRDDRPGNLDVYSHWVIEKGYTPIFMTARPDTIRNETGLWLAAHVLRLGESPLLLMRSEANHAKSAAVKEGQLRTLGEKHGIYPEDIVFAFDDRPEIIEMYANHDISGQVLKIHDVCAYTRPVAVGSPNVATSEVVHATQEEMQALSQLRAECAKLGPTTAADVLHSMSNTFRERQSVYKDNYKMVAKLMAVLFPDGVPSALVVEDQFHLFELMLVKLSRYAISNLTHIDSVHDLAVYGAMCEAININFERKS